MFKWIFLLILAWLMYRSLRNLVIASLGSGENSRPIEHGQTGRNQGQGSEVFRDSPRQDARQTRADDIEDAQWTDL